MQELIDALMDYTVAEKEARRGEEGVDVHELRMIVERHARRQGWTAGQAIRAYHRRNRRRW